jgi:hypothetical protein
LKFIDIDRLEVIENHIHYIKTYKGSAIFIGNDSKTCRFGIDFSIEHKPVGLPDIKIKFSEHPHFPIADLIKKVKEKIIDMDKKGIFSSLHKNK